MDDINPHNQPLLSTHTRTIILQISIKPPILLDQVGPKVLISNSHMVWEWEWVSVPTRRIK